MLACKMRHLCNKAKSTNQYEAWHQIDFCNRSLTSAGKGIIDGLGYFSFLNAVIPERFFQISCKEEKKPSLGISEVDSSLNLYVSRLSCNRYNKMEKIYELELKSG